MTRGPVMVAYGGGIDSTAMLVGMHERGERPDAIVFADTGSEVPTTYATVERMSAWCEAHGFPGIVTVRHAERSGREISIEQRCLETKSLPSIAYGYKACSDKHKRRPQHNWARAWDLALQAWAGGGAVVKVIGFEAGEERRAVESTDARYVNRYPLIEWGWDRAKCGDVLRAEGIEAAKSSCFICPSRTVPEIHALANEHPLLFVRALELEANADLGSVHGLGRRFAWSDLIGGRGPQLVDAWTPPELACAECGT